MKKVICVECGKEKDKYDFNVEVGKSICNSCIEEKLTLINSLIGKVTETDFDSDVCVYVMVKVDSEVREVFRKCGFTDEEIDKEIEENEIDLNLIGFKYGAWFIDDDGYYPYRMD